MQTVLLAIDGDMPDRTVFDFAVQFCRRMNTNLDVLQILQPQPYSQGEKIDEMSAGRREILKTPLARLQRPLRSDDPGKAIASYVADNRNIVLAIYDANEKSKTPEARRKIKLTRPSLKVPLVMLRTPGD